MSCLSLRYPKKPHEVADDIEAMVYILVYFAFRFHPHEASPTIPRGSTPAQVREINSSNENLATAAHQFFFEEFLCQDGYHSGGRNKWLWIRQGEPPVTLKDKEGLLATLLRDLYKLLQEHYEAINYDDLKHFKAERLVFGMHDTDEALKDEGAAEDPTTDDTSEPPIMMDSRDEFSSRLAHIIHGDSSPSPEASSPSPDLPGPPPPDVASSTLSSPAAKVAGAGAATEVPQKLIKNARRVLDTHRAIALIFNNIFFDKRGRPKEIDLTKRDKAFDQFDGLRVYVALADKGPSGSSSKRKKQTAAEQEVEQQSKRGRGDDKPFMASLPSIWPGYEPLPIEGPVATEA